MFYLDLEKSALEVILIYLHLADFHWTRNLPKSPN
jgi:hypothetical protein